MLCSLCSSVIQQRLVLDPSLPVYCSSCAVEACGSCPAGAKRVPYKNSAGHRCIALLNSTTSRPSGTNTQADRAARGHKRYQTVEPTYAKLVRQGHYASRSEAQNAFGHPHRGDDVDHVAILNQPALLAIMQTGAAGSRERAFAILDLFYDQLVLPSETDTRGDNPMAVKTTDKLVSAIETGTPIVAFDIEKWRWDHYQGEYLISTDPHIVIAPPPHNGLPSSNRLLYDAAIGSFDPRTLKLHTSYYCHRLPPAALAKYEIFSGDEMDRLDDGMRAARDAGLDIYHCDGDEGARLKAAGCEGLNLHRGTQKLLGIGYGGAPRCPRGLDRFSIAENVVATLMLLPKLPEGKAVSVRMMKSVVGHTAERDAFRTMFQAHIPLLRAGMELEASRKAKKQKR